MQKRFIAKPVKIVWRNSKIAGNPIIQSFQKFGVYDRNWQNDPYCWCSNPGGKFVSDWQARKYRCVVDNIELAEKIADHMNALLEMVPNAKRIDFNGISSWLKSADEITVKKVEC